jgi:hypothetical protein
VNKAKGISPGHPRQQEPWLERLCQGNTFVIIVLLLVTLVASQDFYLADLDSAVALKGWWMDASFHIIHIDSLSALMQGHAAVGSPETGSSSGVYHFLGYIPAALGCALFGLTPLQGFALIYAPLALFLFAFGIWLLASTCWSREQALWATVLFMLLPDLMPYLLSSHEYLRIKWLVSVSPGLGYGVFVSALAWVLCLRGIRESKLVYIALGFVACFITILVKAHLFVANALPLVMYTIAFYPNIRTRLRGMLLMLFVVTYAAAIWIAGDFPGIPLIRLDFSNAAAYAATLASFQPLDVISAWLLETASALPAYIAPLGLALALLFVHLGALLLLTLLALRHDAKQREIGRWLPAIFIFAVYILHAVGLARDTGSVGYEPIELMHRPFIWGVSLIMVWTFAALSANHPRIFSLRRRWVLCALLLLPSTYFYQDMQYAPSWKARPADYSEAYLEALQFLQQKTADNELVQAANLDPYLVAQAATGRMAYVAKYVFRTPSEVVVARSDEVLRWLEETDPKRIADFAAQNDIRWLVARESRVPNWSPAFVEQQSRFRKDDVVVMQFLP